MYTKQFMTTSEFARICGVSKHTLFHYDDIGILQPEYVNEKGYRYYSVKQFFIFDIIATLQQAKTPLCEIKAYLEHKTPAGFLAILEEKSAELRREEQKIRRMQQLLAATTKMTRSALTSVCQTPSIEQMPAEYLMTVPLSSQGIENLFSGIHGRIWENRWSIHSGSTESDSNPIRNQSTGSRRPEKYLA